MFKYKLMARRQVLFLEHKIYSQNQEYKGQDMIEAKAFCFKHQ